MDYLLLVVGCALLAMAADWLVGGATSVAKRFGVSELVIGLTIVAFGTSAPEFVVNILAAAKGTTEIAITNVLGSNTINTLVILGVTALVAPIACKKSTYRYEIPLSIAAGASVLMLGILCGEINRYGGILLTVVFALFLIYSFKQGRKMEVESDATAPMSIWKAVLLIVVGLAGLVAGGNMIVDSAVAIAKSLGMSEAVIGVTIVALGTSLPELATSVVAARRSSTDLAIGNVIGSNIFNVFLVLGSSALLHPLPVYDNFVMDALLALGSSMLLMLLVMCSKQHALNRWGGALMLACYVAYMCALLM